MTKEEKKQLVMSNSDGAYSILISEESNEMFMAFKYCAQQTIRDLNGCCTFNETACARKNAMLTMLELGLI